MNSTRYCKNSFHTLAVLLLAVACAAPAGTPDASRLVSLEKENAQLRADLQTVSADHAQAISLINEIMDNLAEIAGREVEIRTIQNDWDPATWQSEVDLRQQIFSDLEVIQEKLIQSQAKNVVLTESIAGNGHLAAYAQTAANIQRLLKEKELTIIALSEQIDELTNENEELEQEVEASLGRIDELRQEVDTKDAQAERQEKVIDELREEVSAAYYFIGTASELSEGVHRHELKKTFRTYHASDELISGQTPPGFRVTSPESTVIPLGYNLRDARVVSVHKRYEHLYFISRNGSEWTLRLRDPLGFWSRSRYLVIKVER